VMTLLAAHDPIPVPWVIPFALLLLGIATLPLVAPHFWEHNRNKAFVSAALAVPVALWLLVGRAEGAHWLLGSLEEYVAFIVLLGALFVITGGIYLKGSLAGTPLVNTLFLGIGAVVASFIGTTGASMLLIRPLLRANQPRVRKAHIVVFFIFVVSNGGGMLTPLGDPPLFLGFLRGVPFLWTFRLVREWAFVNGSLLVVFNVLDQWIFDREERERPGSQLEEVQAVAERIGIEGKRNLLYLLGVIAVIYLGGSYGSRISSSETVQKGIQVAGMLLMTALSLRTTPHAIRVRNRFSWAPIVEVAVIFVGIFVTMVPALRILEAWGEGGRLHMDHPAQFFWASGALSSFLDNAPTYLTFSTLACGVVGHQVGTTIDPNDLSALLQHAQGVAILTAISCGAVFMGANTYIGNGPNFMVKAIAEENGVRMPSFFGYVLWSLAVLIPLFGMVTILFFV
jgi:Na+/H+ antiporter NhaD/arsenite permease-like protein